MKKLLLFIGLVLSLNLYAQKPAVLIARGDTIPETNDTTWFLSYDEQYGEYKMVRLDGIYSKTGGGGNVTKVGTPVDNQVAVWTGDGTIEGTTALTFSGQWLAFLRTGIIGLTLSGDNGVSTNTIYAQDDDLTITSVDDLFLTPSDAIRFGSASVNEAEFEILDGATVTTAELNVLDGIPGTLTATELGYSDGVTSAIQTQLNLKAPIADPTFTGEIGIGSVNVNETELGILEGATTTTAELNVLDGIPVTLTATELGYSDGVTSGIQPQLDSKLNTADTVTLKSVAYTLPDSLVQFQYGAGMGFARDTAVFDTIADGSGAKFGRKYIPEDSLEILWFEVSLSASDTLNALLYYNDSAYVSGSGATIIDTLNITGGDQTITTSGFATTTIPENNYICLEFLSSTNGSNPIWFVADLVGYIKRD